MQSGSDESLLDDLELVEALGVNQLRAYRPYPKQLQFHNAPSSKRKKALLGSNQTGKSKAAAAEVAIHLTGLYPDWWEGRRFESASSWWIASMSFELVRDNLQRLLLGEGGPDMFGTGLIPRHCILDYTMSRSISECVDTVLVQHTSGGVSQLKTKAYEQGRLKWQSWTGDGIWYDEEPPADIWSEGITRLAAKQGLALVTFTPLLGATDVLGLFYPEPKQDDMLLIHMTLDEAEHYDEKERRALVASWPEHEREAREHGRPMMGEGLIFPIAESEFVIPPMPIPDHWLRLGGLDFGYDHPTAAVELAYDDEMDVVYVVREYRAPGKGPDAQGVKDHVAALRMWGSYLRFAWPHDGNRVEDKESDTSLADLYRQNGLRLLYTHATWPDGSNGVWAGNNQIFERMQTGRWKVFATCPGYLEERRQYHRKAMPDGRSKIVKVRDDILSAARYALMMLRSAMPKVEEEVDLPEHYAEGYDPLHGRSSRAYDPLRGG